MTEKTTLLIIDDDEAIRDSASQVLGRCQDFEIALAPDGAAGLELARRLRPILALVDLKMAGLGGVELVHRLHAQDPRMAIVVITGYATLSSAVETMKEGACDFLAKPFTAPELLAAVQRGLGKARAESQEAAFRRRRQRLQEKFVTMVSHELRAPLNAMRQYAAAALSGAVGELNEGQREVFGRVSSLAEELVGLIEDWLDLARVKAGSVAGEFRAVGMATLTGEVVESLRPLAQRKGLRLDVALNGTDPRVQGDPRCLRRMISNLLDNAIKYSRDGGEVRLRVSEGDGAVTIRVEDTGCGIHDKDLPFIFDEFYVAQGTGRRPERGTGLGLSLVKQIAELHHGSVEVSSRLGEGSCFSVVLPKTSGPENDPSKVVNP